MTLFKNKITKKLLIIALAIILIPLISFFYYYYKYECYYHAGENDTFKIHKGEIIKIKFYESPSTGCEYCWVNQKQKHIVKKSKSTYEQDFLFQNYEGSGGISTTEFEAIESGIDTLKFDICACGIDNKKCEDYESTNSITESKFIIIVE